MDRERERERERRKRKEGMRAEDKLSQNE